MDEIRLFTTIRAAAAGIATAGIATAGIATAGAMATAVNEAALEAERTVATDSS
jgi:hypothetical protein